MVLREAFGSRRLYFLKRCYHATTDVFGYRPQRRLQIQLLTADVLEARFKEPLVYSIINEFRTNGHYLAKVNPLQNATKKDHSSRTFLLQRYIDQYKTDETVINTEGLLWCPKNVNSFKDLIHHLKNTYCNKVGVELGHIADVEEKEWLAKMWEETSDTRLTLEEKRHLAEVLLKCEQLDIFLATKFPTVKRYSGEGAESMLAFLHEIFKRASMDHGVKDIIIGMAHRGRLNLLACLLNYPVATMFQKMNGLPEFDLSQAPGVLGDVLSHLFTSVDIKTSKEDSVHVCLLPNPSHLEAVNPVVCGKARGKALTNRIGPYAKHSDILNILPIQIHGDAAISGQGVVMETIAMSNTPHFTVDGSIHCVINNQLGYTTPGNTFGRSSYYCSDIMKMIDAPCIHVNGDDPEEVLKAAEISLKYRQTFGKDILVDIVCFRKWGHNELDDPTFTNPNIYQEIKARSTTMVQNYASQVLSKKEIESVTQHFVKSLTEQYQISKTYKPTNQNLKGVWNTMSHPSCDHVTLWETGFDTNILTRIAERASEFPATFRLHSTLEKVLKKDRLAKVQQGKALDWATAEQLAMGSLLWQGVNVRISGQDVGRGTFSQRHAAVIDQDNGEMYIPLNNLHEDQKAYLEVANSILSEEACLGFEYGVSIDNPNNLVIWEAQFGDFFNGAQIILDSFICGSELKWLLQSGLVILLPHGYDGAGPEHSSCRMERFLQMCDSSFTSVDGDMVNWNIVNPTTPAQYFHLLRRQMVRNFRKPLVVVAPKLLLRHPECASELKDLSNGSTFSSVLDDPIVNNPTAVKRIIFCSGKHYYTLKAFRLANNITDSAIVRIEELCPFPVKHISNVLKKYPNVKETIWSQEEHENMGAWIHFKLRFENMFHQKIRYAGRKPLGIPAVGIGAFHTKEATDILNDTFK